jgi:2-polyprenyl-3-methyl-5-hydroxy-6-metoxy-1,4-benzoquinol methylase
MDQTPVHEQHNPDLLRLMPLAVRKVVEVGCSSGALAREYRKLNPACGYLGIEIVADYARLARPHCDSVLEIDVESLDDQAVRGLEADCWIFGDSLEHLRDPWALLRRIRTAIPPDGHVVACIPNAQHWSVQARLACGELRYEEMGLLDRTHLRWFTRITILEMFQQSGFRVTVMNARVFNEPQRETLRPAIELMARSLGADAAQAVADASVFQYVLRAVPV